VEKSVNERRSVQASGRTVEDAIQAGLAELNVSRDQVQVELLSSIGEDPERPVMVQLTVDPSAAEAFAPISTAVPLMARAVEAELAAMPSEDTPVDQGDVSAVAKNVLETLLRGMGIRSQVVLHQQTEESEGPDFVLDIVGADLGILIGRRGETLRDLEYLSRLIVASKTRSAVRFAVDVEGYRARRERVLRELAKRMADRVRQNRQPITLEAMPPNERRIVHITLREHPSVKTQSIGEGDRRRVMILPK
jgi:spoIIIJ-associated protein